MKPIKKITLKDAKVLSDSELRNITGGYVSGNGCPATQEKCSGSCSIRTFDYDGNLKEIDGTCVWVAYNGSGSCACKEN